MGEFFRGWRRKLGVVTLAMALVFMAGWVRSLSILDEIGIKRVSSYHRIVLMCGGIVWVIDQPKPANGMHEGRLWAYIAKESNHYPTLYGWELDRPLEKENWHFAWAGFAYGNWQSSGQMLTACIIPYWFVVLPLSVLSAFLFLSKPHKSTRRKISEPVHVEGGATP